MCSWFDSEQKSNTTQSTMIPANYQNLMNRTLAFANQGLDSSFQAYEAPRIAELSGNEQAGVAAAGSNAGMYQDLINMAMMNNADMQVQGGLPNNTVEWENVPGFGMMPKVKGDLESLMNPYVDYVGRGAQNRLNEASDRNMTNIGSMAGMAGAFGGSRHGVLEGANLAELLKSSEELWSGTYSDAYDKGMNNWFRGQDLRRGGIQDALGIVEGGQRYNTQDIQNLMTTGLTERSRDQGELDFAFSEFMREQQDPYTKANFASSVLGGFPTNLFTRTQDETQTQSPSPFSQIAGIGMAAAGLMSGNPAALAGLGAGQQALMKSSGGGQFLNSDQTPRGNYVIDNNMYGSAKGGLIKGYRKGGPIIDPDDSRRADEALQDVKNFKTPNKNHKTPIFDVLDFIFGPTVASGEYPILGNITGSDENSVIPNSFYEETSTKKPGKAEKRMQEFLRTFASKGAGAAINRGQMRRELLNRQYVSPQDFTGLNKESKEIEKYNKEFPFRKDLTLDQFLEELGNTRGVLKELHSVPTDPQAYKKGGRVKKLASGGLTRNPLEQIFLPPQANDQDSGVSKFIRMTSPIDNLMGFFSGTDAVPGQQTGDMYYGAGKDQYGSDIPNAMEASDNSFLYTDPLLGAAFSSMFGKDPPEYFEQPNKILYGDRTGVTTRADGSPLPGAQQAQQMPRMNWDTFMQRHKMGQYAAPRPSFPNPATPRLPAQRPDLSGFMSALQNKLSGSAQGTPRGFATGGPVSALDVLAFAKGGSTLLDTAGTHDGSLEDITYTLDDIPDEEWAPTVSPFDGITDPGLDIEDFERGLFNLESKQHGWNSLNKDTKAFGRYQFLPSTWNDSIKRLPKAVRKQLGVDLIDRKTLSKYNDGDPGLAKVLPTPEQQREVYRRAYLPESISALARKNLDITPQNLYVAHHFGPNAAPGIIETIQSDPNVSMRDALLAGGYSEKKADNTVATNNLAGERGYGSGYFNNITKQGGWLNSRPANNALTGTLRAEASGVEGEPLAALAQRASDKWPSYMKHIGAFKGLTEEDVRAHMKATGLRHPADGRVDRVRPGPDLGVEPLSPLETVMGGRLPKNAEPDYLSTLGIPIPVEQEDLGDPRFVRGGQYGFSGGGYVKKFAKGQKVETDPYATHSTDEDVLYKWDGNNATIDDAGKAAYKDLQDIWKTKRRGKSGIAIADDFLGKTLASGVPIAGMMGLGGAQLGAGALDFLFNDAGLDTPTTTNQTPKASTKNQMTGLNMGIPDYGQGPQTPLDFGTAPENLIEGVGAGNIDGVMAEPLGRMASSRNQELQDELDSLMLDRIRELKGAKETDTDPLKALFGDYNQGLFKMGMGILANSGYPNSAGEAIAKGVLGAQESEENRMLAKNERKNQRLKELLNARYMSAMIEQMSPDQKLAVEKLKGDYDLKKESMKDARAEMQKQADFQRQTQLEVIKSILTNSMFGGTSGEGRKYVKEKTGYDLPIDTSDIEDTE